MIIELLQQGLYSIFSLLTSPISIPSIPDNVIEYSNSIAEYIGMGASVISVYTDLSYLLSLFGIIVIIDTAVMLYNFVMWVIRKVPLANIS